MMHVVYFKDDHGRILRVAIHGTGIVELHLSNTPAKNEKVWVPLPQVDMVSAISVAGSSYEAPLAYGGLVEKARTCPLFEKG